MTYSSEVDALRQLLLARKYGGYITGSPRSLKTLPNGLPYYYVEVTPKDKTKYVIEAYGEDAAKLRNESQYMKEEIVVLA